MERACGMEELIVLGISFGLIVLGVILMVVGGVGARRPKQNRGPVVPPVRVEHHLFVYDDDGDDDDD